MKKRVLFGAVLFLLVFAGTALAFNFILNKGYKSRRVESSAAALPQLSIEWSGQKMGRLRGYRTEVNPLMERDQVIPVGREKQFSVLVPSEVSPKTLDYELWDAHKENLIESGELSRESEDAGMTKYPVTIRMDLTSGQEYLFLVRLKHDGDMVSYYSRVVRLERDKLDRLIPYAENLSKGALEKKLPEEGLPEAWTKGLSAAETEEPDQQDQADTETAVADVEGKTAMLDCVNLNSEAYDVQYGALNLSLFTDKIPELREVTEKDAVISFHFGLVAADGKYFTVRESMTVEYDNSDDRVKLREYVREMNVVPGPDVLDSYSNSLVVGVASDEPDWVISKDNTRLLYTADGTVWFYDYKNALITELFGRGQGVLTGNGYRIMPLYVDEKRADFMVLGRIPEGRNEGKNGILIQSYDVEEDSMSELLLLETAESPSLLIAGAEKFHYYDSSEKTLQLLLDDKLIRIRLADGSVETLVEGIPERDFWVSEDQELLIYPDTADPTMVKTLSLHNYANGTSIEKNAKDMILTPVGFIDDCFIYGASYEKHMRRNADGTAAFHFSSLFIIDQAGKVIKEYHKAGKLIRSVEFVGSTIYLGLAEEAEGGFTDGGEDYISYKPEKAENVLTVTTGEKDGAYVKRLSFPGSVYLRGKPAEIMPTWNMDRKLVRISEEYSGLSDSVFLYDCSGFREEVVSTGEAIRRANDEGGYVVKSGQPLYRKREAAAYNTVAGTFTYEEAGNDAESYRACLVMALRSAGMQVDAADLSPEENWEEAFAVRSNTVRGLNFSGADLDTGVLFLGEGSPFVVRLGARYVLVVSYNDTHIRYYDPVEKEEIRVPRDEFKKNAEQSGNEFYTWRRGG